MKRVFLLAHPAGHSISPAMHNAAFEALGVEASYEALDVEPAQLAGVIERLRERDVYGANVTIPHKLAVKPVMDELTGAAKAIGAVNTIVNRGGRLLGHNTDASGFMRALREDGGFEPAGKQVVLLGAGGSARAVAYGLLTAGVATLELYNRTIDKARALAETFKPLGPITALEPISLEARVKEAGLLVNTTSVGMEHDGADPDVSPLPAGCLPDQGFVCDIIYRPIKTRLLREAEAAGLRTQNGLPMLVYQGAESFRTWTGLEAPIEVMTRAARAALVLAV